MTPKNVEKFKHFKDDGTIYSGRVMSLEIQEADANAIEWVKEQIDIMDDSSDTEWGRGWHDAIKAIRNNLNAQSPPTVGRQRGGMQTTSGVAPERERLTSFEKETKAGHTAPAEDAQPQNNCVPAPPSNSPSDDEVKKRVIDSCNHFTERQREVIGMKKGIPLSQTDWELLESAFEHLLNVSIKEARRGYVKVEDVKEQLHEYFGGYTQEVADIMERIKALADTEVKG